MCIWLDYDKNLRDRRHFIYNLDARREGKWENLRGYVLLLLILGYISQGGRRDPCTGPSPLAAGLEGGNFTFARNENWRSLYGK